MIELFKLMGKISVNRGEVINDLKAVDKSAKSTGASMGSSFTKVGKVMKATAVAGVLAIGAALLKLAKDGTKNLIEIQDATKLFAKDTAAAAEETRLFSETITALHKVNTDSYKEIGDAVTMFRKRFGELTGEAEKQVQVFLDYAKVTEQDTAEAIRTTDGILKAFNLTLEDAPGLLDKLYKAQQQTGIEAGVLQKAISSGSQAFKAMNMNLDESIAFISSFEKQGVSAQSIVRGLTNVIRYAQQPSKEFADSFKDLGIAVDEAGKPIGGAEAVIKGLREAMTDGTVTQKEMAAASQLLGNRVANDMVRGLQSGEDAIKDLQKSIENSEKAVKNASDEFDKQFGERWTLFKRQYVEPLAEILGKGIVTALESSIKKIEEWSRRSGQLFSAVVERAERIYNALSMFNDEALEKWLTYLQKKKEAEDAYYQKRMKILRDAKKKEAQEQKTANSNMLQIQADFQNKHRFMLIASKNKEAQVVVEAEEKKKDAVKKSSEAQTRAIKNYTVSGKTMLGDFVSQTIAMMSKMNTDSKNKIEDMTVSGKTMLGGFVSSTIDGMTKTTKVVAENQERWSQSLNDHFRGSLDQFMQHTNSFKSAFSGLKDFFKNFFEWYKDTILNKILASIASKIADVTLDLIGLGETSSGGGVKGPSTGQAVGGAAGTAIGTAIGGPVGGAIGGVLGSWVGGLFHEGGVVGYDSSPTGAIAWSNPQILHSGGIAGNEVPAILERGEEVITRSDPRHRYNNGAGQIDFRVYMDSKEMARKIFPAGVREIRTRLGIKK